MYDICYTIISSSLASSRNGLLDPSLLFLLFGLGIANGFVDGKNGACSLSCSLKGVHLHQKRLPNEGDLIVANTMGDINSNVQSFLVSFLVVII